MIRIALLLAALAPAAHAAAPAPTSPAAAAQVIREHYAALDARRYTAAWRMWGDGGRANGQSLAAFRAGFARTRTTRAAVRTPGLPDGGAESIYVTVPVTVRVTLVDGTRQRFAGSSVLRRVNDVDGSSAAQRRWHIASARLRRVPAA